MIDIGGTSASNSFINSVAVRARGAGRGLACSMGLMAGMAEAQMAKTHDIVVTGQPADPDVNLVKIPTSMVDTPQSISTVTADELQQRGVTTLTDALRTVPGISLGAGETSWQGNNFYLRGFTTRNDTFLDGMRDYGYYFRDPFNDAEIEVLKGPSSVLFGRGATGGAIQQITKQPSRNGFVSGQLSVGTANTERGTIDVDTPFGETGAIRINAMGNHNNVADRDYALSKRWGVAPTATVGLGTLTRFTLSWLHQEEDNRPDYGIPWFNGAPAKVDRSTYYGFADDYLNTNVDIVTGKLEHDLSSAITLHGQLRYSNDTRSFRTSEAVIPATTTPTTPLTAINVTRNEFSGSSDDRFVQGQADATIRFSTGPFRHTLVAGIELGQEKPKPTYVFHVGVIGTSLVNPPLQPFTEASAYTRLTAKTDAKTTGLYAIDTILIGEHVELVGGGRWDQVKADYNSIGYSPTGTIIGATNFERDDRKFSPRAAFVFKPEKSSSLYLSYATSFNPSTEGIESLVSAGRSVAQANLNAAPETSRSWEAGGKRLFFGDRLLLSAAIFQTTKTNVRIPDPTNSSFNTNGGKQRVRGVELEANGQITPAWSVHAAFAHMASETLSTINPTAAGAPRIGAELPVTPKNSASIETDYLVTPHLSVGGGAIYQSSRLGQNTNSSYLRAPGYTVFDARLRYKVNTHLALQANLLNLTNKLYYDQLHPFHVVPGAGRSLLFSLIFDGL